MSYADEVFIQNCRDILENGVWDTDILQCFRLMERGAVYNETKKVSLLW